MSERFHIESNGAGGWITRDRRHPTNIVASSAFREFASRAADRLNYGERGDEWRRFYRVED